MDIEQLFQTFRPSFLVLTPACIFLGLATAIASDTNIDWGLFLLILLGAVMAHISVNTLNEYFDFKSGLDLNTTQTPFSGGSGTLPKHPEIAPYTLMAGLVSSGVTTIIGIYFIQVCGPKILPIGILGITLVLTYTQWLNKAPLLCLFAPGLGTGTLMIVGTHLILTGEYAFMPFLVSFIPFFLNNNLLLLNQYPDMKADAGAGRKTFPIVYGINKSNFIYALFSGFAYGLIGLLVLTNILPSSSLIALFSIILSSLALFGATKFSPQTQVMPKFLGANVAASIITPLILGVTLIIG